MEHALVANALCARLVRIHSRNNEDLVLYLFLNFRQPCHVLKDSIFAVCRAGPDDQKKFIFLSAEDLRNLLVSFLFNLPDFLCDRKLLLQFLRNRQSSDKLHLHFHSEKHLDFLIDADSIRQ